ncbi:uncharacterized protein LOC132720335 [Ruditapes philippinarum]|uniref:uncharacterized protein LOC132720335 n=1 Tax=Ruditapes philippinarum TaxID=129788 RepID=UPI00295AAF9A|nr:uncharacterized protein LOC132720335 [Ruditapes philippinarum]
MNNTTEVSINNTDIGVPRSGYDLPVYGLSNGSFYRIHIPALTCISLSLCCVIIVMVLSYSHKNFRKFFSWAKRARFIIYFAICDGGFNIFHGLDHLHYLTTKDHIRPKILCEFYGFLLTEFITAQNLLVNVVAINAFIMMFFNKNLNFGRYDWKLLAWTFGLPFVAAIAAAFTGQLGPNGTFCQFDAITGSVAFILFTTVPTVLIFIVNSVLYLLTWKRIKEQVSGISQSLKNSNVTDKSRRAARNMSLFVLAFFIQWWSCAVFSVWLLIDINVPLFFINIETTLVNLGGCLNLAIYLIMRRRDKCNEDDGNKNTMVTDDNLSAAHSVDNAVALSSVGETAIAPSGIRGQGT